MCTTTRLKKKTRIRWMMHRLYKKKNLYYNDTLHTKVKMDMGKKIVDYMLVLNLRY